MDHQPQQRFCTTCGQPLVPGAAFCVTCGMQASVPPTGAPGQFSAGAQPGYPPPYAQAQNDPLPALLAAGYVASRRGRPSSTGAGQATRVQATRVWLSLAGPFIGVALTSGRLNLIFTYVCGSRNGCALLPGAFD